MKRFFTAILLAVALCFCAGAGAQEIRGGNYGTVGYIKATEPFRTPTTALSAM